MPSTLRTRYLGDLRVECEHLASKAKIITDAPVDNHGKGESFSPSDLACAALASCAMTIMGIKARELGLNLAGSTMDITKTMSANPRRIAKVEITYNVSGVPLLAQRLALQEAAEGCPVCLSLGPETEQVFTFKWLE